MAGLSSVSAQALTGARPRMETAGYAAEPGWHGWGPAQAYAVPQRGAIRVTQLPAPPVAVEAVSDDPIDDALARDPSPYGASLPGLPLPGSAATDEDNTGYPGEILPPLVPERYTWDYLDTPSWSSAGVSSSSPGLRGAPNLRQVGLGHTGTSLPWSVGASSWAFTGDLGADISVGSQEVGKPEWARGAKLGGVNIADAQPHASNAEPTWNYSVTLGALDGAPSGDSGDLAYGAGAGYASLSYGLSQALTLESQVEVAPSLVSTGLGGELRTSWGAWSAGVARASGSLYKGWRYQTAYTVDVLDNLQLTWLNEAMTAGFSDLSSYENGPSSGGANRQKWSATIPAGRWGDISGSYESLSPATGDSQRSFGLTQQFWYSPNLQIGLSAKREIVSGDYDVGIRFSVPVF